MISIFESDNYKESLRERHKGLQSKDRSLTLKSLAQKVPIQYTYLSKFFNDPTVHLGEDHLFSLCRLLDFPSEESDFILLQRSYEVAADNKRKEYLFGKIKQKREEKNLNFEEQRTGEHLAPEMAYLFNPKALLVHVALSIPHYRMQPERLCQVFEMTLPELKEVFNILVQNGYVDLEEGALQIKEVRDPHIHFGPGHPLMRVHQNLFKTLANSKFLTLPEDKKYNFMVTFTADKNAYAEIQKEFRGFLKKVEAIAGNSLDQNLYQLGFELFPWDE